MSYPQSGATGHTDISETGWLMAEFQLLGIAVQG
jgi:hypothetical protein